MKIPFIDLHPQQALLRKETAAALAALNRRGDFILGQDEKEFETEFGRYIGSPHAVGLNSGTDALFLSLKAMGIGPGDEVIVPAFTFIATSNAVAYCGAKPVFCDIDPETFCMRAEDARKVMTRRTKAVIPVHLFGQCCDMDALRALCAPRKIRIIEDACQAHGAAFKGAKAGAMGDCGCFSFYPTKNLGGWGDGGMVVTADAKLHKDLCVLRDCGRSSRYVHSTVGYNSRLDSCQAAVLRLKLKRLDAWNRRRQAIARSYDTLLGKIEGVTTPKTQRGSTHVYHVYAIKTRDRDGLAAFLNAEGIGTMINYPIPLHLQEAYSHLGYHSGDLPAAESVCGEILSLPMHPFLTDAQVRVICARIRRYLKK